MVKNIFYFFLIGTLIGFFQSCQTVSNIEIETYELKKGNFISSVTETGEVAALSSQMISAPRISWRFGRLKISKLVEDGKLIEKGEMLVEFDKAEVQKGIIDTKADLEIAEAELRKALVNQISKIEDLEAELEKTTIQHRISELNLEKASFESEIRRKEIELNLERAKITLEKAGQEIENQKMVHREEINKLKLKVKQAQKRLDSANEAFENLTVIAPTPGIAIIEKSLFSRNKYQVNDQPFPGWPLIGLPDLSRMKALVEINEVDIAKIDTTLKAKVRLDAFPDTVFWGKIFEVATLARNKDEGSKVKVFDVTILLDETSEKLMPGMTVRCEIIVSEVPDTLFVPLEALFIKNGDKIVYLKQGGSYEPRRISIGQENDDYVIVTSGLKEGDQVALSDPMEGLGEESNLDQKISEGNYP